MTMDNTAIKQIQESANIEAVMAGVQAATADKPFVAVPESMNVKNLENYMPLALRQRAQLTSVSLQSFAEYVNDHGNENSVLMVDAEDPLRLSAKAVIDFGTVEEPLHKEHSFTLNLQKSAAYQAYIRTGERNGMSQRDVSDFIEDWADHITAYDADGDRMSPAQAADALRRITIARAREAKREVGDMSESGSLMESVEARSQERIPAVIIFKCVPFVGFSDQDFEYRVGILTASDEPVIKLRPVRLEIIQEKIAQEFVELIDEQVAAEGVKTYLASV